MKTKVWRVVGLAAAILTFAACDHVQGPSLNATVEGEELVPTASEVDPTHICCCRVRSAIRNDSSIAVHASIRWNAKDSRGEAVGTAFAFIENLAPGERRAFDAAGILQPCSRVASLQREDVRLKGLFSLP